MRLNMQQIMPWLWLAGCFASAVWFFLYYGTGCLNADMSSEMLLSKLIAEEGNWVFSDNWFYSTELRVVNIQILWAALFRFLDDWQLVRVIGTVGSYVFFLACFRFFLVRLGWQRIFPWAGGALLLPLSSTYQNIVLIGVFYTAAMSLAFLALGFMFWGSRERSGFSLCALAGVVLAFLTGLGGPRQIFVLYLPFFVASLWLFWYSLEGDRRERYLLAKAAVANLSNGWSRLCVLAFSSLLASSVGYLINKFYLHSLFPFQTFHYHMKGLRWGRIKEIALGWLESFGAPEHMWTLSMDTGGGT